MASGGSCRKPRTECGAGRSVFSNRLRARGPLGVELPLSGTDFAGYFRRAVSPIAQSVERAAVNR